MSEVFLKIVNMSISAGWLVLAVLVLRFVLKKAPKWIHVLLWGIVAVRLVCPFSMESSLSLIPSAETISPEIMMSQSPTIHTGVPAINSVVNPIITETFAPEPFVNSANPLQIWIPVFAVIWIIGMCILALYTIISYWCLRRKVSEAVILRDNIYQSENVASPFVLGFMQPKIYLPYHMDGQNLEYVIAHEGAHIRRRDHWWKPVGFLLLTIHWFNPLMWFAYILLCRDIELACDEKVIKEMGNEQRADYTQALVSCSIHRGMIAACPLAFGEVGVKERVKSVLNYKKPALWVIVVSLLICAVVAVCFLTNPVGFRFDGESNTIVSANHFDMRNADDAVADEMNLAQIDELSSRLADVRKTKRSDQYGGLTPGYQISALLQDGTYIRISGYSLSDDDMVDIEWNGERYVVSDNGFQEYLSHICASGDVAASDTTETESVERYGFSDVLGYSGYVISDANGPHNLRSYYAVVGDQRWLIAETFGFGDPEDYVVDLDGDGITELVANVTYGGDGVRRVYVYQRRGDEIYLGAFSAEGLPNFNDWGVNSTWSEYEPATGIFRLHYALKNSDDYGVFETKKLDRFRFDAFSSAPSVVTLMTKSHTMAKAKRSPGNLPDFFFTSLRPCR